MLTNLDHIDYITFKKTIIINYFRVQLGMEFFSLYSLKLKKKEES